MSATVPIEHVFVRQGRRELRDVEPLMQSIDAVGLLNPISVDEDGTLVAGLHRLEACRRLGWERIPVSVVTGEELDKQLAEIDENLIRNELTVLERSECLARRKEIYESRHPEAAHGAAPAGGRKDETVSSFAHDTACKAGVSPRDVQQQVKIAKSLTPQSKEAIRGTALEDRKVDLIKLSRVEPEDQEAVIAKVVRGEARNVTAAVQQVKREQRLAERQQRAAATLSTKAARRRLRYEVLAGNALEHLATLEDFSANLVVTDPPYGLDTHRTREGGHTYADGEEYAIELLECTAEILVRKCAPGAHLYVFSGYSHAWRFRGVLEQHFEVNENPLVWVKNRQTIAYPSRAKFANRYELIWFCRAPGELVGLNDHADDVFAVPAVSSSKGTGHSAEKPVALLEQFVTLSSAQGELVVDPFCGSGSTGEAASKLGRAFFGVELDPKWAEVARARQA